MTPTTPPPGTSFVIWLIVLVAVGFVVMVLFKVAVWWGERYGVTSTEDEPKKNPVRAPVYIPVSSMPYQEGGIADIDAETPFNRDITDGEWIVRMACARGPDKKYRFSANAIHAAIGGDRNSVLAKVREIRATPPPAEYMQPDGSRVPATHPVTGQRQPA
jgi:hypothetical protein